MKRSTLRLIGNIVYCYMLPTMGTMLLILAMFHKELDSTTVMSSESDTLLKVIGLIMCTVTWFAAFQYWNSFVREFTVQMTEEEIEEYLGGGYTAKEIIEEVV